MKGLPVALRSLSLPALLENAEVLRLVTAMDMEQAGRPKLGQLPSAGLEIQAAAAAHAMLTRATTASPVGYAAARGSSSRSDGKDRWVAFHGNTGDQGISCAKEARWRLHLYGTGIRS